MSFLTDEDYARYGQYTLDCHLRGTTPDDFETWIREIAEGERADHEDTRRKLRLEGS